MNHLKVSINGVLVRVDSEGAITSMIYMPRQLLTEKQRNHSALVSF